MLPRDDEQRMSKNPQKEYGKVHWGQRFISAADAAVARKVPIFEWLLTVPPAAHSVVVFRSSAKEAVGLVSARWTLS
jgi:hypothetical protein